MNDYSGAAQNLHVQDSKCKDLQCTSGSKTTETMWTVNKDSTSIPAVWKKTLPISQASLSASPPFCWPEEITLCNSDDDNFTVHSKALVIRFKVSRMWWRSLHQYCQFLIGDGRRRDCLSCGNRSSTLTLSDGFRFILISYDGFTVSVLVSSWCLEVTISVSNEVLSKSRKYYCILLYNSHIYFFCILWSVCYVRKLIYEYGMKMSFCACCAHKGEMFSPKMGGFCLEFIDNKRSVILCVYTAGICQL